MNIIKIKKILKNEIEYKTKKIVLYSKGNKLINGKIIQESLCGEKKYYCKFDNKYNILNEKIF